MNRRRSRVSTSHPPTILARSRARQLAERSINNPMQTNESAPAHAGAADLIPTITATMFTIRT